MVSMCFFFFLDYIWEFSVPQVSLKSIWTLFTQFYFILDNITNFSGPLVCLKCIGTQFT
jgi:hypothetical protein